MNIEFIQVNDTKEISDLGFDVKAIRQECSAFWLLEVNGKLKGVDFLAYGILGFIPDYEKKEFIANTQWLISPDDPALDIPYEDACKELDINLQLFLAQAKVNKKQIRGLQNKAIKGEKLPPE